MEKIKSTANLFKHLVGSDRTGIDTRGDGGYVIAWGDLTREIIAGLADWPTQGFADTSVRDHEVGRKRQQQQSQQQQSQPDDLERVISALKFIPADDRVKKWKALFVAKVEQFFNWQKATSDDGSRNL